jgi:hypothetical protein
MLYCKAKSKKEEEESQGLLELFDHLFEFFFNKHFLSASTWQQF